MAENLNGQEGENHTGNDVQQQFEIESSAENKPEPQLQTAVSTAETGSPSHLAQSTPTNRERTDVCRDFLKNICNRGSRCKYYHPIDQQQTQYQEDVKFCIDYQNRGCTRENCRYVHAHREDADRYKRNGEVGLSLARAIAAVTNKDNVNGIPFCKEFQTGNCSRGNNRCRYWHIIPNEERERRRMENYGNNSASAANSRGNSNDFIPNRRNRGDPPTPYSQPREYAPPMRGGYDGQFATGGYMDELAPKRGRFDPPPPQNRSFSPPMPNRYLIDLERKISDLEKDKEQLSRELQRERERYEDLYTLFRQQTQNMAAAAAQQVPASYSSAIAPVASLVATASTAPVYPAPAPFAGPDASSLAQVAALAPSIHQSRPPITSDVVNVHWCGSAGQHWST